MKAFYVCDDCVKLLLSKGFELEEFTSYNFANEKCCLCNRNVGTHWIPVEAILTVFGKMLGVYKKDG